LEEEKRGVEPTDADNDLREKFFLHAGAEDRL